VKDPVCAELVARCFNARTVAHFAHLRTRSYAQHVALNEFYDAIVDAADAFAECHMGIEGQFTGFPAITPKESPDFLDHLTELHTWVAAHRTECADGSTELANLIDEILAVIDRSFYKLKFLK
jgi:hypothetical protein